MKSITKIFLILFLGGTQFSVAQFGNGGPKSIAEMKQKSLLVLQYDSAFMYNQKIKDLVISTWKYSKYEFIHADSLHNYSKRKDIVILGFKAILTSGADAGSTTGRSKANGDKLSVFCLSYDPDYYYHPFSDLAGVFAIPNVYKADKSYWYGTSPFVGGSLVDGVPDYFWEMNYNILLGTVKRFAKAQKNESIANWFSVGKLYSKTLNPSSFKNKTLCILKSDVPDYHYYPSKHDNSLFEKGALNKSYSNKIEILSDEKYNEVIKSAPKDKLIFETFFLGGGSCCLVYDPELKEVVYANCITGNDFIGNFKKLLKGLNAKVNK